MAKILWFLTLVNLFLATQDAYARSCRALLSLRPSSIQATLPGISSIPTEQLEAIEEVFREGALTFGKVDKNIDEGTWFSKLSVAKTLVRNLKEKNLFSQTLEKLGFKLGRDSRNRPTVQVPNSIFVVFHRYELRMQQLIEEGTIRKDEVVRPALILEKTDPNGGDTKYQMFSPVTDVWPGPEWVISKDVPQFSHQLYYSFVASGRVPFSAVLNHDLSHLADLYIYPEIMRQYGRYGHSVSMASKARSKVRYDDTGFNMKGREARKSEERSVVYGEWFSLPDISRAKEIKSLLKEYFSPGGPKNLNQALESIQDLPKAERIKRMRNFIDRVRPLILQAGGGMKDVRSYYVFDDGGEGVLNRLVQLIEGKKVSKLNFNEYSNEEALKDSLPKMVDLLEHLYYFTYESYDNLNAFLDSRPEYERSAEVNLGRIIYTYGSYDTSGKYRAVAETRAIQLLAQLEMAFFKAVDLGLTLEIAYKEGRTQQLSTRSKFFKYLKSFVDSRSYTYQAFELGR